MKGIFKGLDLLLSLLCFVFFFMRLYYQWDKKTFWSKRWAIRTLKMFDEIETIVIPNVYESPTMKESMTIFRAKEKMKKERTAIYKCYPALKG